MDLGETRIGELHRVIGTDIEQRAGVRTSQHLDFLVQPGPSLLPIEDHRVDTVVLKHALHHMTFGDQEEMLRECGRCLAHDGHIVIYEDTYSTAGPPLHDAGGFHRDMLRLVDSARIRLLLASFDIWPQTYKDKDMPFPSTYPTVQGREDLFARLGFGTVETNFYGLSDDGFAAAPLGIFVLQHREENGAVQR